MAMGSAIVADFEIVKADTAESEVGFAGLEAAF
jgi:hypothetical protein